MRVREKRKRRIKNQKIQRNEAKDKEEKEWVEIRTLLSMHRNKEKEGGRKNEMTQEPKDFYQFV